MTAKAMMRPKFRRPAGWYLEGQRIRKRVQEFVTTRLVMALNDMQYSILQTPVYTGRTLVNFRWNLGSPIESTRGAVKDPALPGRTSDIPIGAEPRRQANAAVVQAEFEVILGQIKGDPFQKIFLNNNLDHFSEVEYGTYARDGQVSRTPPSGMTRRGETLLRYDLAGLLKNVS